MQQFNYQSEKFADIQMLRYKLEGFDELSPRQKAYIYCLAKATLYGRDITFDQQGRHNILVRKTLEAIASPNPSGGRAGDRLPFLDYLKRVWFSSGIHHHYGCEKFKPLFSEDSFQQAVMSTPDDQLPLANNPNIPADSPIHYPATKQQLLDILIPVIFDPDVESMRVNQKDGDDLVLTSACNFYEGVTQQEVEDYYNNMKRDAGDQAPSYGLNSKLVKRDGVIAEEPWTAHGLYANAIRHIIHWLEEARSYAENDDQRHVISLLIDYYTTGDLSKFDEYSIAWVSQHEGRVDFINGFIEVYGDPLGLKGTWEGLVEYKDPVATRRTQTIARNAQWFEDHSPVAPQFRKPKVKGVSANVICAAMLGGEEYPASAIGINLPNANWIRQQYGSKSVTIGNLTDAYNKAAHGNGFLDEFVVDKPTLDRINRYGDLCDDLHTDLHECLGHGSGQLLPGTDPDALKAYGNTIEEARADLFGLYYIADHKLVELGLLPNDEAYKSQYYTYLMNGLLTQLVRIQPGHNIEEAHMRNRALIAHWVLSHSDGAVRLERTTKTFVVISDYPRLRQAFAELLAEIQRIKSEGDYEAARMLVEEYAVKVDPDLHQEVMQRYKALDIAPYKGFINPRMTPVLDAEGVITDVILDYSESYEHQMIRYGREYATM